jgi:hypothetical protein
MFDELLNPKKKRFPNEDLIKHAVLRELFDEDKIE